MTDPAAHSPCTPPTPSSPATLARGCLTSFRLSGPLHVLLLCLEPSSQEIHSVHSRSSFRSRLKCHLSRGASLTVLCKCHCFPLHDLLSWRLHHLPLCIQHLLCLLSDSLTGKWVLEGDAVGMGSPPLLRAGISDVELGTWNHYGRIQVSRPTCHTAVWGHRFGLLKLLLKVTSTELLPLASSSPPRSPLVKAVFHTCRAMHASLPGKADGQQSSFCHCERASGHLWSSLNVSGATCDPTLNHVSGGLSGPSGRCSVLVGKNTLTHLELTQPMGLSERQRPGRT